MYSVHATGPGDPNVRHRPTMRLRRTACASSTRPAREPARLAIPSCQAAAQPGGPGPQRRPRLGQLGELAHSGGRAQDRDDVITLANPDRVPLEVVEVEDGP